MTQITLATKQKQTHRRREQAFGCQVGRGWSGSLELADANPYI